MKSTNTINNYNKNSLFYPILWAALLYLLEHYASNTNAKLPLVSEIFILKKYILLDIKDTLN